MGKKKKNKEVIPVMDSIEATLHAKERFNPFQTGYGEWKSEKYPSRSKQKEKIRKEIAESM